MRWGGGTGSEGQSGWASIPMEAYYRCVFIPFTLSPDGPRETTVGIKVRR
jgi:hypothetical protein